MRNKIHVHWAIERIHTYTINRGAFSSPSLKQPPCLEFEPIMGHGAGGGEGGTKKQQKTTKDNNKKTQQKTKTKIIQR